MTPTTKSRILRTYPVSGTMFREPGSDNVYDKVITSRQVTVSEGHGWPKGRSKRDVGGNFDTFKLTFDCSVPSGAVYSTGQLTDANGSRWYVGNSFYNMTAGLPAAFVTPGQTNDWYGGYVPTSSSAAMDTAGATMISQSIPTNSIASTSIALAELYREGLPSLIGATFLKNRTEFFRSLGSEYLNYQFGWAPFVSDLQKAARAISDSEVLLNQLKRDSGRDVHRRRYLPPAKTTTTSIKNVTGGWGLDAQLFLTPNTERYSKTTERGQWFSGSFTYYFDPGQMTEVERIVKEARLLLGIELTPETLWNLAPWSWLVDWVFNIGPVLHNISMFQQDGLVMRYGYVMEFNSVTEKWSIDRGKLKVSTDLPDRYACTYSGIRKVRRKATPYGFGLDFAGFTTRQWAILAALGMTRAPRTL